MHSRSYELKIAFCVMEYNSEGDLAAMQQGL
jgi:hypothetical protein